MKFTLRKALRKPTAADTIFLLKAGSDLKLTNLTDAEIEFVKKEHRNKHNVIEINRYKNHIYIVYGEALGTKAKRFENYRKYGYSTQKLLNDSKIERTVVYPVGVSDEECIAFTEGLLLANYQFLKYFKNAAEKEHSLKQIDIYADSITEKQIEELSNLVGAVYEARDLVNEPLSFLTADQFANEIKRLSADSGAKIEVFSKKKIEALKMGGLLAVNKGSIDPPTFSIIEWKPRNKVNSKPYVFIGKGVVYDTGGLSLKPTNYMDTMKCDMAGGAAVASAVYAIAKNQLPVHVIAIVPATDNRPDGNAYVPGDVIKMYDGTTVEVLNTDAEGRMILADALSYAKQYNPELVIDVATLTGAAVRAIGSVAMAGMHSGAENELELLKRSGDCVNERIVEFPMWDEYGDMLKSKIADLKNIGGAEAGMITAGKFLEHFTDYPYIHLDIAGPAFLEKEDNYRGVGGTGYAVRLLYDFIKSKVD